MSRTRIVKGKITQIIGGDYNMYSASNIIESAATVYSETAKGEILWGDNPRKPPVLKGNFIIDGEWLDKDGKPIDQSKTTHAKIGETIFFRVKTKDISENTPIFFELWEHDGISIPTIFGTIVDIRAYDDYVPLVIKETGARSITANVDKNGYATISVELTEILEKYIEEDAGNKMELYFIVRYLGFEPINYLPRDSGKYLKVGYSDRTLYIQPATDNSGYGLPEFRTADGDILIFSGGVETEDNTIGNFPKEEGQDALDRLGDKAKDKIMGKLEDKATDKAKDLLQKGRTTIAIHQLKMKKLAFNDGQVRQRKQLYSYKVFDKAGENYEIQKASNYGFKNHSTGEVVTSKGISQLDYFRETNIYSKVAKVGMNALECLSFLDLAKFISGNGGQGQIPSPIPALDFVIGLMLAETKEQIKEMTDEAVEATLETAKDLGIKGIEEFINLNTNDISLSTGNVIDMGVKKYQTIEVSQDILENLLAGKIRKFEKLQTLSDEQRKIDNHMFYQGINKIHTSSLNYLILYRWEFDERINDYVRIIETVFKK